MEARLKEIIAEVIAEKGAWMIEVQTMPDQVHLLVEVDPQLGIHKLVNAVMGRSSRVLREEFASLCSPLPTLWTNSYFVASVDEVPRSVVKRCVDNQTSR